jgi:hypothetical protein
MQEELLHFGVKGMRWGHRKSPKYQKQTRNRILEKTANKKLSDLRKSPPKKRTMSEHDKRMRTIHLARGALFLSGAYIAYKKIPGPSPYKNSPFGPIIDVTSRVKKVQTALG